jgi:hypothetical protein
MRRRGAAALVITAVLAARVAGAAGSINPANDELLKLGPAARAAKLAAAVGNWCIGTQTFLMGVETEGTGAGNAYWSLRCAEGTAWAVQVDPLGEVTAIGCDAFKAAALGKECFKKF